MTFQGFTNELSPQSLTVRPCKIMVETQAFPIGKVTFQGLSLLNFRRCIIWFSPSSPCHPIPSLSEKPKHQARAARMKGQSRSGRHAKIQGEVTILTKIGEFPKINIQSLPSREPTYPTLGSKEDHRLKRALGKHIGTKNYIVVNWWFGAWWSGILYPQVTIPFIRGFRGIQTTKQPSADKDLEFQKINFNSLLTPFRLIKPKWNFICPTKYVISKSLKSWPLAKYD